MRFYVIGKSKHLTRKVISRWYWRALMLQTEPYRYRKIPDGIQN